MVQFSSGAHQANLVKRLNMSQEVGIDSNCLTLLIEAVDPSYDPMEDSAKQAKIFLPLVSGNTS